MAFEIFVKLTKAQFLVKTHEGIITVSKGTTETMAGLEQEDRRKGIRYDPVYLLLLKVVDELNLAIFAEVTLQLLHTELFEILDVAHVDISRGTSLD